MKRGWWERREAGDEAVGRKERRRRVRVERKRAGRHDNAMGEKERHRRGSMARGGEGAAAERKTDRGRCLVGWRPHRHHLPHHRRGRQVPGGVVWEGGGGSQRARPACAQARPSVAWCAGDDNEEWGREESTADDSRGGQAWRWATHAPRLGPPLRRTCPPPSTHRCFACCACGGSRRTRRR